MITRYNIITLFLLILLSASCRHDPDNLERALHLAGSNRKELEKVLWRYGREDSLKYRAAVFLIENMPFYSYYEGKALDDYLTYYSLISKDKSFAQDSYKKIAEQVISDYGRFTYDLLQHRQDILTLDSAYICNNIDWAFKVWREQPWGKNVSFETFCEYILPYRIGNEKPEYWREKYYNEYNTLLEPLKYEKPDVAEDPISAVFLLMQHITKREEVHFTTVSPASLPHVGASVARFKSGACRELTDYAVYVCRALGIPCHIDFVPIRGNDNVGHFWLSYTDKEGELYAQDFPESVVPVRTSGFRSDPKVKAYRYTFSYNAERSKMMNSLSPAFLRLCDNPMFEDVTYPYSDYYISEITVPRNRLYNRSLSKGIAYLCIAQHRSWTPVTWTVIDRKGITFTDIQKGSIMRIATWENNSFTFQSDPFRIHPLTNEITFYKADNSVEDITVYTKFTTIGEREFNERLLGGVFEASNDPEFVIKDTLFVINRVTDRLLIPAKSKLSQEKYRYVRYYGPEGSHCNISEIAFYETEHDSIPLSGKIIGTPGSLNPDDPHEYTNVFDGKTTTSFDYKNPSGGWTGLDLGQPKTIIKIVYSPRNRDNYIRIGDQYELFYFDKEWKSKGIVISRSDSLFYKDVPKNTLLYLKNHTRGIQERIFTYENNKQIWW